MKYYIPSCRPIFSIDTKSHIKSLWIGWWLITWTVGSFAIHPGEHRLGNIVWSINFYPKGG